METNNCNDNDRFINDALFTDTLLHQKKIIQALLDGKTVEYSYRNVNTWLPYNNHILNFDQFRYRIVKKPREWWINIYKDGPGNVWREEESAKQSQDICRDFVERVRVREVLE